MLSPLRLDLTPFVFEPNSGVDLATEPYTREAVLTDGGVYDNLGLETVWKNYQTVLVSDGGGHMRPEEDPHAGWARHALRINDLIAVHAGEYRRTAVHARHHRRTDGIDYAGGTIMPGKSLAEAAKSSRQNLLIAITRWARVRD